MIYIRKSKERGFANHGWLKSSHTFSFADYHDDNYMGFGVLRVINEDRIQGGSGFSTHGHRDMEIISYVIEGALEHKDSMGSDMIIKPNEVQRMSAGTGVRHSEHNHYADEETHFLQIWILPEKLGVKPDYAQKSFAQVFSTDELILVVSKNGRDGSISINQDVNIYVCNSSASGQTQFKSNMARRSWIQVIRGTVVVDNCELIAGDGAGVEKQAHFNLSWGSKSEFIVFDLP